MQPTYSNEDVFKAIKYILSPRFDIINKSDYSSLNKLYLISSLTKNITDEKLLKNTIGLLEKISFLKNIFSYLDPLDDVLNNNPDYSESDKVKIKAIVCSIIVDCDISNYRFTEFLKNCDVPKLNFKLKNRILEYNLSEIVEFIKRKSLAFKRNEVTELPIIKDQETEIKKMIQSMEIVDYENETDYFRDDIRHLESIKKNLTRPFEANLKLKHEDIFSNNGFELFEYILIKHIKPLGQRGRKNDIYFFYWKMFGDPKKYIHQRPVPFTTWFFKTYNEEIGDIKTLDEVKNTNRSNQYSDALDWFKQ